MAFFCFLAEAADVPVQVFHDGGILLQEADGFERRRGERGRNAHGEHEPRQVVAQILDERAAARKVSAAGTETLGERAHFNVDIVPGKTEVFVHAAAGPAEHARRVRLVDHQEATVLLLDAHKLRHGGNVAVHAVHALGDDEHLGVLIAAGAENGLERGGVVVREGAALGVREARALVDGIVRERVIDDEIALAAEVADDRHVRGMPADENNGVLGMLPRGDGIFQLFVDGLLAAEQTAGRGAAPVVRGGLLRCLDRFRAAGHTGVIVGAEIQDLAPVMERGIAQRRIVAEKVRVAGLVRRAQTLLKGGVFRRILKARDRRYGLFLLRRGFRRAALLETEQQESGVLHAAAESVFLLRYALPADLLEMHRDIKTVETVAAELVKEVGGVGDGVGADHQRLRERFAHKLAQRTKAFGFLFVHGKTPFGVVLFGVHFAENGVGRRRGQQPHEKNDEPIDKPNGAEHLPAL